MNISGFRLRQHEARLHTIRNVASLVAIIVIFVLASSWDYNETADRALTSIAQTEAVRSRTNALTFCKGPTEGQVLVMRHDAAAPRGVKCTTYERFDWPQVAVRVDQ
jgi:hypothetical protein